VIIRQGARLRVEDRIAKARAASITFQPRSRNIRRRRAEAAMRVAVIRDGPSSNVIASDGAVTSADASEAILNRASVVVIPLRFSPRRIAGQTPCPTPRKDFRAKRI
jgi:hypothetical protein